MEFYTRHRTAILISIVSLIVRLILSGAVGAGFDEAYYYTYAKNLSFGYFDHPPMVALVAGLVPFLTGIATPFTIRLVSVILFTFTGWFVYEYTRKWFAPSSANLALLLFHGIPMFFIGIGIAVLPDVSMAFFWGVSLMVLRPLLAPERPSGILLWAGAGVLAGLTLASKYHGVLLVGSLCIFLVVYRRFLLSTLKPYVFVLSCAAVFSPVLIWNAHHDWVSFVFQGGRASGGSIRFDRLLEAVGGQIGYLTPMAFIPLAVVLWKTCVKGIVKGDFNYRFAFFFGSIPYLFFLGVSLKQSILPHWTLAGCIALLPPMADTIASFRKKRVVTRTITISLIIIGLVYILLVLQIRRGSVLYALHDIGWVSGHEVRRDATLDMVGWDAIPTYLNQKGLSADEVFLFSHKWYLGGEISLAADPSFSIMCLNRSDSRGFGVWNAHKNVLGRDGICIYTNRYRVNPEKSYGEYFERVSPPDSTVIYRGGRYAKTIYFSRCENMIKPYPLPYYAR